MAKTAFCRINENNEYVAHSDKFEKGLFIAPIPELKANTKAIWTGKSWKIVKTNMNYSSEILTDEQGETNKSIYITKNDEKVELSSYDNTENGFFVNKFTTEKQLLDVEIIKLIENNKEVPTEWSDYSNKLDTYIQYLETHLVHIEDCEVKEYHKNDLEELNNYTKTNFNILDQFLTPVVVIDTEKAKELLCLDQNDFNILSKYNDEFTLPRYTNTRVHEEFIIYNTKDYRIVNSALDKKLIDKNIEDGIFRRIRINELLSITDEDIDNINLPILSDLTSDDNNSVVSEDEYYYDAHPEYFKRLDLYKLCVRYYEYYEEKYNEFIEPLITEEPIDGEIDPKHLEDLRNSRLRNNFLRECFVRFNFRKNDYQKDLERYQRITGKTTFRIGLSDTQHDLPKILSDEELLANIAPSFILSFSTQELSQPDTYTIVIDYSKVFEGYQDIFDLIDNAKVNQSIIDIEELEKEQAKIPEGIQPHMLKGPATLYETDRK